MISFDDGAMTFPEEDLPAVGAAAHAVVNEAKKAGVWIFGGGLQSSVAANVVTTDGVIRDAPHKPGKQLLGGFSIIEVSSRDEALSWAAKFAAACRCDQDVREIMDDPDV